MTNGHHALEDAHPRRLPVEAHVAEVDGKGPAAVASQLLADVSLEPEHVLVLQKSAGNAAVAGLLRSRRRSAAGPVARALGSALQRDLIRGPTGAVMDVEFTVGSEISLKLAIKAKAVAATGVTDDELKELRSHALWGATISDDERMFLAGLLELDNAKQVAGANVKAGTRFRFSRSSIERHLAKVKDFERPVMDPGVQAELSAAYGALGSADAGPYYTHLRAARPAAIKQIYQLATPTWRKQAEIAVAQSFNWTAELLRAMISGASDSTAGDMVMAGSVWAVAALAGHPVAKDILNGRIKVDQLSSKARPPGRFAEYHASGGKERKGDTIYVYSDLNIKNLFHRAMIIHELQHALDDRETPVGRSRKSHRDGDEERAYRAGARYMIEHLAFLKESVSEAGTAAEKTARDEAVKKALGQLAPLPPIHLTALVRECHRNRDRYNWIVLKIAKSPAFGLSFSDLQKLWQEDDTTLETKLRALIRKEYKLVDDQGNILPGKNVGGFEGLSGESVLDSVDRR